MMAHPMTTPVDIEKLKELVAKATKRPWVKFYSIYGDDTIAIMKGKRPPKGERWKEIIAWPGFDGCDVPKRYRHENAELIVAAVNSLPALIAKAERVDAMERIMREIEKHATMANNVIRLNRDGGGNGRVKVATCMHHIERLARNALSPKQPCENCGCSDPSHAVVPKMREVIINCALCHAKAGCGCAFSPKPEDTAS